MWFEFQLSFFNFCKICHLQIIRFSARFEFLYFYTNVLRWRIRYINKEVSFFWWKTDKVMNIFLCLYNKIKIFCFSIFCQINFADIIYIATYLYFLKIKIEYKKYCMILRHELLVATKNNFLEKPSICWSTSWPFSVKGYLHQKTIVYHKAALDV